ncbi:hypothetical protein QTP81_13125 [Alteromonas sp. ASW11-36]|uniref:Orphan protein n=1 Tax=Alteromonas arenosi TaxID=3055817 RepID=A0ABT7SZC3_9ALTE|nr:hypothetical protein [Alteromonas sp. ASW11-36]MDM7861538.1 hypothetical protein [Alteromonas sp. ASW11-36]
MAPRLPLYKKLSILIRLEPGCLGPEGKDYIEAFCTHAKPELKRFHGGIIRWKIEPRYDKSLPEIEYQLNKTPASHNDVKTFFSEFDIAFSDFEEQLDERLAELIEHYFERI